MRVTVEFFGPAREAAGTIRLGIDCDVATTAADLVTRFAQDRGGRLAQLLLRDNHLSPSVLVAVNDRQTSDPTPLKEGDEITVIPPVSGGAV